MEYSRSCLSKWCILLTFFSGTLALPLGGQTSSDILYPVHRDNVATFFDFVSQDASEIVFHLAIDSLVDIREPDTLFTGMLTVIRPGDSIVFKADFSIRGNFRRKNCDFPPLRIDLSKAQLRELGLAEYDDYKVVTHCLADRSGPDLILKEYLLYKMFNNLTDYSYRATLLPIIYVNSHSEQEISSLAFIIENNKELADRLSGNFCDCPATEISALDPYHFELMCLFHYMVGNRDMHVGRLHNLKLLQSIKTDKLISIPYDFDFSAFVGAPYIYPGQENKFLVDRLYLGSHRNQQAMKPVYEIFLDKKESLVNMIMEFEMLSKGQRRSLVRYVNGFYRDLEKRSYILDYQY